MNRSKRGWWLLAGLLAGAGCGPEGDVDVDTTAAKQEARVDKYQAHRAALTLPPDFCQRNPSVCNIGGTTNQDAILGRGWNVITDQDVPSMLSCLDTFTIVDPGMTAPRVTSRVAFVSDVTRVKDVLALDARVTGGLPAGSIPVSGTLFGEYNRTANTSSTAIQLLVHTRVEFNPRRITSVPALTSGALGVFDNRGALAFRKQCGDKFVEQVKMGAEFLAVLKISSTNTSVQSKLAARISADIGASQNPAQAVQRTLEAANADLNANFSAGGTIDGEFENTAVQIHVDTYTAGIPLDTTPVTMPQVISRLQQFPTLVTSQSDLVELGVVLKPYSQSSNFNQRPAFSIADASNSLNRVLGPAYLALTDAYNELSFALSQPAEGFFPFNTNTAANLLSQVTTDLNVLEAELERCGSGEPCTEAMARTLIGNDWQTIRSRLPIRKQLYTVSGRNFKEVADIAGRLSTRAVDGWTSAGLSACHIDFDDTPTPPATENSLRVWTSSGIAGSGCRYKLFNGASLRAPWQLVSMNTDLDESTLVRMSSSTNLTLELTQFATVFWPQSYVHTVTLAGPAANPASEPWRAAIR